MPETSATPEDVRAAYRLVLGRDPDPTGFADHVKLIRDGSVTCQRLLSMFLNSTEFRAKESGIRVGIGDTFVVVNPSEPEFGQHIVKHGSWEPHIINTIVKNLALGEVFVDVGANVGVMSFAAARTVGHQGKIISFEPNEENARYFLRGIFENRFQKFVRLHRFALSDRCELYALRGSSNTYLVEANHQTPLIQSLPGDEILDNEPVIHFIKIDIEGHEPFAISGLSRTIQRHKPLILCEFNPRCLKEHVGVQPLDFAAQIFEMTRDVRVIEHNNQISHVSGARELMDKWDMKNEEASKTGLLPYGMIHFDLLFRVAS